MFKNIYKLTGFCSIINATITMGIVASEYIDIRSTPDYYPSDTYYGISINVLILILLFASVLLSTITTSLVNMILSMFSFTKSIIDKNAKLAIGSIFILAGSGTHSIGTFLSMGGDIGIDQSTLWLYSMIPVLIGGNMLLNSIIKTRNDG